MNNNDAYIDEWSTSSLKKAQCSGSIAEVGSEDAREERLPLETTLGSFDKEDRY